MDDLVFRTKQEPVEQPEAAEKEKPAVQPKKDGGAVVDVDKSKLPVTAWEAEYERPYSADYFNLGQAYDELSYETKDNLKAINDYFLRQVRSGKMKGTQENFEVWVNKIKSLVGVEYAPSITQVNQIADYIKTIRKNVAAQ